MVNNEILIYHYVDTVKSKHFISFGKLWSKRNSQQARFDSRMLLCFEGSRHNVSLFIYVWRAFLGWVGVIKHCSVMNFSIYFFLATHCCMPQVTGSVGPGVTTVHTYITQGYAWQHALVWTHWFPLGGVLATHSSVSDRLSVLLRVR